MSIATEREFFEAHRDDLLGQHPGEFVVIFEETLHGFFSEGAAAYEDALSRFGPDAEFIVVELVEPNHSISLAWDAGVMFG